MRTTSKKEFEVAVRKVDPKAQFEYWDPCFVTVYCKMRGDVLRVVGGLEMRCIVVDTRPLSQLGLHSGTSGL